jgi:hypothetical protein
VQAVIGRGDLESGWEGDGSVVYAAVMEGRVASFGLFLGNEVRGGFGGN